MKRAHAYERAIAHENALHDGRARRVDARENVLAYVHLLACRVFKVAHEKGDLDAAIKGCDASWRAYVVHRAGDRLEPELFVQRLPHVLGVVEMIERNYDLR